MLPPVTFDELLARSSERPAWLWDGLLLPGAITLLTAQWKTGKTTLLSHLLRAFEQNDDFLGRSIRPARAIVLTEEGDEIWRIRGATRPFGPHLRFHPRPFGRRPTPAQWEEWIADRAAEARDGKLDLVVIDPASSMMPISNEASAACVIDALASLGPLLGAGAAVLIVHHPRKGTLRAGQAARGSGAWGSAADIVIEMRPMTDDPGDRRRVLSAGSRFPGTPRHIAGMLTEDGRYIVVPPELASFEPCNYAAMFSTMEKARDFMSVKQILEQWPEDHKKPHRDTLFRWLRNSVEGKMLEELGDGLRNSPFRYALVERLPIIEKWNAVDPRTGFKPLTLDEDENDPYGLDLQPELQMERSRRAEVILKGGLRGIDEDLD